MEPVKVSMPGIWLLSSEVPKFILLVIKTSKKEQQSNKEIRVSRANKIRILGNWLCGVRHGMPSAS
jgi:hypothetical protein